MEFAEAEFRTALEGLSGTLEWQSTTQYASAADFVAQAARSADLVITGISPDSLFDAQRRLNMEDLVMQAGRPVLIVPAAAESLLLDNVVIGWKDTREARRAAFDALPLLKQAATVAVVEIIADGDVPGAHARLDEVVNWLKRHSIEAEAIVSSLIGDEVVSLNAIANERDADVVVAGAYGHSRVRQWALGGLTRGLLLPVDRCSLVSH